MIISALVLPDFPGASAEAALLGIGLIVLLSVHPGDVLAFGKRHIGLSRNLQLLAGPDGDGKAFLQAQSSALWAVDLVKLISAYRAEM